MAGDSSRAGQDAASRSSLWDLGQAALEKVKAAGGSLSGDASGQEVGNSAFALENKAHELADRLPDLVLEAMRITNTVTHGIHGRRRAGPGETFWQFRQFGDSDARQQIDWRRSASSDHLFVREREWEAAHTVWLWANLSASMNFQSHLSQTSKRDRAITLMLAIGELLVRGGERIALLGLTRPSSSRKATTKITEAIAGASLAVSGSGSTGSSGVRNRDNGSKDTAREGTTAPLEATLPPKARLSRFTGTIIFSDFLEPIAATRERMQLLAADGVSGHLVQVLDPAEETLPYEGRAAFYSMDGNYRWVADRAESLSARYQEKFLAHRAALQEIARSLGWSFLVHHTDRPASEALLTLSMRLQGDAGDYRWTGNDEAKEHRDTKAARGQTSAVKGDRS